MTVSVNHKMNLQDVLMVHFNIRFHRDVVIVINSDYNYNNIINNKNDKNNYINNSVTKVFFF